LVLFIVLTRWKGTWPGSRFALGLAGYGIIRFFLQFFRGDSVPVLASLDDSQIFSIMFVGAACGLWFRRGRKLCAKNSPREALKSGMFSVENVQ
jgi:prolipoprotein diacylglyceryltransferase